LLLVLEVVSLVLCLLMKVFDSRRNAMKQRMDEK